VFAKCYEADKSKMRKWVRHVARGFGDERYINNFSRQLVKQGSY
jgi:hypothetical protein